jgi:hypothetical protein
MARHRHIRNIDLDDELDDDDPDRDYYGKSVDEEPLTPSTCKLSSKTIKIQAKFAARFIYHRNQSNSHNQGDSIEETNEDEDENQHNYDDDGDIFDMDDGLSSHNYIYWLISVAFQTKASKPRQQQPKKATFVIGGADQHKSPKPKKPAQISAIEHLKISELKPSRAASKSPSRITPNASFHQFSAIDVALNSSPTHK